MIELLLNDPDDKIIRSSDIFENIKERLLVEKVTMRRNLDHRFSDLVQLKEKSYLKARPIVVNITGHDSKLVDCSIALIESERFSILHRFLLQQRL